MGPEKDKNCAFTVGDFVISEKLGKGGFGTIRLATHTETGKKYAAKIFGFQRRPENTSLRIARQEVCALRNLSHPHIVKVYQVMRSTRAIYIILSFCDQKDLYFLISGDQRLNEDHARLIFRQLLQALSHCHEKGLAHMDIKPENVLLDRNNGVQLCDFGTSVMRKDAIGDRDLIIKCYCGTPKYMPLEPLEPELAKDGYCAKKVDVWSCGMILLAMTVGRIPYNGGAHEKILTQMRESKHSFGIPKFLSDDLRALLKCIFQTDPKKRPCINQVLESEWCKSKSTIGEEQLWTDIFNKRSNQTIVGDRASNIKAFRRAQIYRESKEVKLLLKK